MEPRSTAPMPEELAWQVRALMGEIDSCSALGRATQGDVWRVRPARGSPVVVKRPHAAASFRQELEAYRTWVPALGRAAPRLLHAFEPPTNALVLEWIDGSEASAPGLDATTRCILHEAAGRLCRLTAAIGGGDVDHDELPLHEALAARLDRWCQRAEGKIPDARLRALAERFDASVFAGERRVFAHRDFSPWNWIAVRDPQPRLVVVDFGHARPDAPLTDLLKLWDRPWVELPATREAFFRGFGRLLSDVEAARLEQLALLHGLATATWGREHGDVSYAALGDTVLDRLRL